MGAQPEVCGIEGKLSSWLANYSSSRIGVIGKHSKWQDVTNHSPILYITKINDNMDI